MSSGQHNHECGGDAAAYVLGALESDEAEAFRRHLEQCVVCRDEIEAFEGVVSALPMAAPQLAPPRRLRRRVMRGLRDQPTRSRRWPEPASGAALRFSPRVALGALAAAAVLAAGITTAVLSGSHTPARVVQAQVVGKSGSARLLLSRGRSELVVHHLPPPPPGHVYEVWLKRARSAPRPANVLFSVNPAGSADVGLPPSLAGISQVMVSAEPDGGSPAPTSSPVIVAQLT